MRHFLKPFSFLPAMFLMYIIYSFSGENGVESSALSYKVSNNLVVTSENVLDLNLTQSQIDSYANKINGKVRKLAHFTEYAVLAVCVSFPLYVYGLRGITLMMGAGIICVSFAASDEYHQSFIIGRTPSIRDVCIDSMGVCLGIICVRIIGFTGGMTLSRKKQKR